MAALRAAINAKCLDCSGNVKPEVARCTVKACALWPVRPKWLDMAGRLADPNAEPIRHPKTGIPAVRDPNTGRWVPGEGA